jgi:ubiquinone/menaquinone biosynthesis C-methylase UbiE
LKIALATLLIKLGIFQFIPQNIRWWMAHEHHVKYKLGMLSKLGEEKYYALYDENARHLLKRFNISTDQSGKTIIDVGAGIRGILGIIDAEKKIIVDPSLNEVAPHLNLPRDIVYLSHKAEDIPLPNDYADIIVCTNALNHVEDPEKALFEIFRILKNDGLFLFETYIQPYDPGHPHIYSEAKIKKMLQFCFKKIRTYSLPPMEHEVTGEKVKQRWGGVFTK